MSLIFVFIGFFSPLVFFPLGLPLFIGDYGRRQHLKAALMFTLRSWRHLCLVSLSLKHCPALTFFDISQFHIPWDISLTSHFGHSIFWYTRKSAAFGHIFPRICCRHSRAVSWHLLAHSSIYPSSRICCRHPLQPGLTASVSWEVMGRRWPAHVAQARYHGNNPTSWNAFAKKKLAKLTRLTV